MKVLCVLTNMFPYGKGEAYMESEVQHYDTFEKVFLCSLMIKEEERKSCRQVPENITVIPVLFARKIVYAIWAFAAVTDPNLYREIRKLIQNHSFNLSRFLRMLIYFTRAHYEANIIWKQIGDQLKDQEVVFYSYRFEYQPYVAVLLRKRLGLRNAVIVSRAHRYDLYEERNKDRYIPFREGLLEELRFVYPCSDHGKNYLQTKFPLVREKIVTKYLGTKDYGVETNEKTGCFTIISCSNVVPVKRMDKIVETLKLLKGKEFRWIHFGDGEEMPWLKKAITELPPRIHVELRGSVNNAELLQNYRENYYDLFINLSDSEGLPVSIMEAMSFGIPCVATDVGGTSEIVKDGFNGLLIDKDAEPAFIAGRIDDQISNFAAYRKNARATWENAFDETKNYSAFAEELKSLI